MEKKYKLPKEFAEKWIAALRSGEYEQGFSYLFMRHTGCYCVLGVAGRIAGIGDSELDGLSSLRKFDTYKSVPKELATYAQEDRTIAGKVSMMNDRGIPFSEIADWLETNVEFI